MSKEPRGTDPYNLRRFIDAQENVVEQAQEELRQGRKRTHWMWFIFPQIEGLGSSPTAEEFAISSLDEAAAYLKNPILGPRLVECTRLVNAIDGRSISDIFDYPDDLKFRSSMTLFSQATPSEEAFQQAISKYFNGEQDSATLAVLRKHR